MLHCCPHNRQATGLRGEDVDLIRPLPHITEEILYRIGRLNVSVHTLRKGIKGQEVLFAGYRLFPSILAFFHKNAFLALE